MPPAKSARLFASGLTLRVWLRVWLSRNPSSDARFRQADFADTASLPAALKGIELFFLACSDDPHQDALEINMINACGAHGVRHVVKLSAQSAGLQPPVSFGRLHAKAEQALRDSGMAWTFLRPVFFGQSLLFFADSIKCGKLIAATGKGKVAWVDVRDVAEVAASVLLRPAAHAGKAYTLTGGAAHSFAEVTEMLHATTGKPVKHISPPAWFAKLVLPPGQRHAALAVQHGGAADGRLQQGCAGNCER